MKAGAVRGCRSAACVAALWFTAACASAGDSGPVDRTTPPTLADPEGLSLPPVVRRELPNGLEILMVEHHELPIANFIMLIGTGGELDPGGREGVATLTAAMLDEGTSQRDALAISDQAAYLGASLATSSGWDASRVSLQTTTAQLDSALALFADVILHPSFPENEFERLKRERQTTLIEQRDNPSQVADIAFARILFGEANPYGRPLLGNDASITAITRQDVQDFYGRHYRPNASTLIVVGDFRAADMEQKLSAHFAAWERSDVPAATFSAPPERSVAGIYLVDKPGAPQSSVRIGHIGVARATTDYFPLLVANTVLGVPFTSRLNMNLRERKAYTYGARSRFDMRKSAGPFVASAEVVAPKTDSSLIEFMKELNAIRDTVPADELLKAKRFLQLQLPSIFETTGDIAERLVPVALYDLPLDYYDGYAQAIEAVTQADVHRVANQYINPSKVAILVVGDRKSIEAPLRKLGMGEVQIRALDGTARR